MFFFTVTDSLYFEKKHWEVLVKTKLVGEEVLQCKKDYESGAIFYGLFLAPEIKIVQLSMNLVLLKNIKRSRVFRTANDCK